MSEFPGRGPAPLDPRSLSELQLDEAQYADQKSRSVNDNLHKEIAGNIGNRKLRIVGFNDDSKALLRTEGQGYIEIPWLKMDSLVWRIYFLTC
jgi:hypothetical protein